MPLFAGLFSRTATTFALPDRTPAWTLLLATLLAGALALAPPTAQAQFGDGAQYRPQVDYQLMETGRFEWIYPASADTTTALFQGALQRSFQSTRFIVGTSAEDLKLPVVISYRIDTHGEPQWAPHVR